MNRAPTDHDTGAAILNVDTESGSTNPVILVGNLSSRSALSTSDGSVAIEELELKAMSCGSTIARANREMEMPLNNGTTRYSSRMPATHIAEYATM